MIASRPFQMPPVGYLLALLVPINAIGAEPAATSMGKWLIDRGRHLGLQSDKTRSRGDAEMILLWMTAASRVAPDLAESYQWQYDLAARLGHTKRSLAALKNYVRFEPDDATARLRYIERSFSGFQTVEKRLAFCEKQLTVANAPEIIGDLHTRLSDLFYRRGDHAEALVHARRALEADPLNVAAQTLRLEHFPFWHTGSTALGDTPNGEKPRGLKPAARNAEMGNALALADRPVTAAERIESLLSRVRTRPSNPRALWNLARMLDSLSMHGEARLWYEHALDTIAIGRPGSQAPPALLLDFAQSAYDGGIYQTALDTCEELLRVDPAFTNAAFLLIRSARKLGRHDLADQHRDGLRRRFEETEADVIAGNDALRALQIAWFHIEFDVNPVRAARFAEVARRTQPNAAAVGRIYGICRLLNDDLDEAERVLAPLAVDDQWAADALSRVALRRDDKDRAIEVLRLAEQLRHSGKAYEEIVRRLAGLGEAAASKPDRSPVRAVLARLDRNILRFVAVPQEFLTLEATFAEDTIAFGEPFACTFRLANHGPFPITLGRDRMVWPQILVSVRLEHGDGVPSVQHDHYLTISLAKRSVLLPGESISVVQTLDVGVARKASLERPGDRCRYTFTIELDPVIRADGTRASRLNLFRNIEATVFRSAARVVLGANTELIDRIRAPAVLAGLLVGGPPHVAAEVGEATPAGDRAGLRAALLKTLADPSPFVRVRALDALDRLELDPSVISAAAVALGDSHWLVRLLAVDLFARRQGRVFEPVLARLVAGDPDPLVRRLASLHLASLNGASEGDSSIRSR